MVELQVVHNAYRDRIVKLSACSAVCKLNLAVFAQARRSESRAYILFLRAVKYGSHNIKTERPCRITEVNFKHLTDIHSGGNAEGVKHYIKGCAVGKEGHILLRKDS